MQKASVLRMTQKMQTNCAPIEMKHRVGYAKDEEVDAMEKVLQMQLEN